MARDLPGREAPELQDLLDALDDPDCRTVIEHLDTPMTAKELSESCDIPLSTMYRKLDLLGDASLLEEQPEIGADGRHTTRYARSFEEVRIGLDDDRAIEVAIRRRDLTPDERLSTLWSEVRKET